MSYLLIFIVGVLTGAWLAWNWGWNSAVRLYEERDIMRARERAEQDRK